MSSSEPFQPQSDTGPDNPAVDPDTGIPRGAADGEGEAADPADLGPVGDRDDDDPPFRAPEPAEEDSAASLREEEAAFGRASDTDRE